MTRVALTIAGSDSGGGAGIQADLKTFSALGVYGASVVTALTAQNTCEVRGIQAVPPAFVAAQIDAVFDDIAIDAVKIGMLGSADVIAAAAAGIERHRPRAVVLDPVMVAKSGDRLLAAGAVAALRERLVPMATVITPNLPEAADLLGMPEPATRDDMAEACRALHALGPANVLLKGGHLEGRDCIDLLFDGHEVREYSAPRVATRNTHGTGCTLSAAIAALLARGRPLADAVAGAKAFLTAAIGAADALAVGRGRGPVHHFHHWWGHQTERRP